MSEPSTILMRQKMHGINCLIVECKYDAEGNRTAVTYPTGYEISATYDDINRLNEIKDPDDKLIADYDYNAMRRTGLTLFNSGTEVTFTSYTYDDAHNKPNHLIALSNWKAGTDICISSFDYTYDIIKQIAGRGARIKLCYNPRYVSIGYFKEKRIQKVAETLFRYLNTLNLVTLDKIAS